MEKSKNIKPQLKVIDRIIAAYKAKRLRLQAAEIQSNVNEEDLLSRMTKGYNKNRDEIEKRPKQPEPSQADKRKRKIADLLSRSNSWKGLE